MNWLGIAIVPSVCHLALLRLQRFIFSSNFWLILFTGARTLIEAQPVVEYTGEAAYK